MRSRPLVLALVAATWATGLACVDDREPTPTSCFIGRTRVRTPSGDRRLDELRPGDEVVACDPVTGQLCVRKVLMLVAHPPADTFTLDAGEVHLVGVTREHPIWVVSRRAWVTVADLAVGDVVAVFERDGEQTGTRVLEAIRATGRSEEVFDLAIEGPEHTFFADDILVHNKTVCGSCWCMDCGAGAADADDSKDGADNGITPDGGESPDARPDSS